VHRIAVPTPLSIGDVNIYFLPGRSPTLIDTGPCTPAAFDRLEAGLTAVGSHLSDVSQVVITHTHVDHFGLASRLHRVSGCRVVAHTAAVASLDNFERAWQERLEFYGRVNAAAGVPPAVASGCLETLRARGLLGASPPAGCITPVRDGARLRCGDATWTVRHTPGHSPDHIALHHQGSASLFVGDLLLRYFHTVPVLAPAPSDGRPRSALGELVSSWRAVGRLPVGIAWPGHGAPIRAHRVLVARRLATVRTRLHATQTAVNQGATTVWEVIGAIGLPTRPDLLDLSLSEAAALLGWLVRRGLLSRNRLTGVVRYAPIDR
jgi:glyoxylase-like metal-dependent hydrolase (beta-lactamase superfamily II)